MKDVDSMTEPKTLQEAIVFFSNPDNCLNYMIARLWPDGVVTCPTCGRKDVVFLKNQRKWQCKSVHFKRQFTVKVGTIYEDSPLPLDKWLMATDDYQLQERRLFLRDSPRYRSHAENRLVHASPSPQGHADQKLHPKNVRAR